MPLEEGRTVLDPTLTAAAVDENTIGVVAVLGSTQDGDSRVRWSAALAAGSEAGRGQPRGTTLVTLPARSAARYAPP